MDPQDRQVSFTDPSIPASIRAAVAPLVRPGHTLWRCPRHRSPGSTALPAHRPDVLIEWWLLDASGELVESFWEVATPKRQTKPFGMPHFLLFVFCLCVLAVGGGMVKTAMVLLSALVLLLFAWGGWLIWQLVFHNK